MSLRVRYVDVPVGAQEAADFYADSLQPFGAAEQLRLGVRDIPWATLEPGSWTLDGTRALLPQEASDLGFWSRERTEADGRFAQPPVITVSFPRLYTATGITFWFWPSLGHWCSEMQVSWYNGQTLIEEKTVYPSDSQWVLSHTVENFDRVTIRVLATNVPGQFAKIGQIQIGQVMVFSRDALVEVRLLNEIDPSLCELSADAMTVSLRDRKDRRLIPQKNQQVQLFYDEQQVASHYIVDSQREAQQFYTLTCQSAIGQLEDDFLGGIYCQTPVEDLLSQVLENFSFSLDAQFRGQTVTGYLPICTRREALQQIAFALGAAVTTQGDGTIRLTPLPDTVGSAFTQNHIFSGAKVSRHAQTAAVKLTVHSYAPGEETETLLNDETVQGSNLLFLFSQPHYDYVISGGTIDSSGENWVRITADGQVKLTAKKYTHSAAVWTKTNPQATAAEKGNVVSVEAATLVHPGNGEVTLNRLYEFYRLKQVLTQKVVVTDEKAGQLAQSMNPWGTVTVGYITGMESVFTDSGHTADIVIQGIEHTGEEQNLWNL